MKVVGVFLILLLSITFSSAQFGYTIYDEDVSYNNNTGSTNSSQFWRDLGVPEDMPL